MPDRFAEVVVSK